MGDDVNVEYDVSFAETVLFLVALFFTSLSFFVSLCVSHLPVYARMFSALMGDNVAPRKEFINQHADNLKLDDLDF